MPLYVKDNDVAALAERLASLTGATKTQAVREALTNELAKFGPNASRVEKALAIGERLRARAGPEGLAADKTFIDSLYEDG